MDNFHELVFLTINQQKTTEESICWTYNKVGDEKSTLYIKKWRVPDEIPDLVMVTISEMIDRTPQTIVTKDEVEKTPVRKKEEIRIIMRHKSDNNYTIRYDSILDNTGVNSMYIPRSSFRNDIIPKNIQVLIRWG